MASFFQQETIVELLFDENDAMLAFTEWGCNCGPAALASVLKISLDDVRPIVEAVGFGGVRYMSPTMMRNAVLAIGKKIKQNNPDKYRFPEFGLARIQWHGPWTEPGANAKWAYRYTHWVANFGTHDNGLIFDVNGGLMSRKDWESKIVPALIAETKRANGDCSIVNSWEIKS